MRFAERAAIVTVGIQFAVINVGSEICLLLAAIRTNAATVVVFPVVRPFLKKQLEALLSQSLHFYFDQI